MGLDSCMKLTRSKRNQPSTYSPIRTALQTPPLRAPFTSAHATSSSFLKLTSGFPRRPIILASNWLNKKAVKFWQIHSSNSSYTNWIKSGGKEKSGSSTRSTHWMHMNWTNIKGKYNRRATLIRDNFLVLVKSDFIPFHWKAIELLIKIE